VALLGQACRFEVGVTRRSDIERRLGTGQRYPQDGWSTYAIVGPRRARWLLSAFYRHGGLLIGVEHYVPKAALPPALVPRMLGRFRLVPGEVELGAPLASVFAGYSPAVSARAAAGPRAAVYDTTFEAHFPGGVAFVMGNAGTVERLALYADR
jgi:hypothetical protein